MRHAPEGYILSDCGQYLISPLRVMKSGYYVGRDFIEADPDGEHYPLPWDRDTGYYRTADDAKAVLAMIEALEEGD